MSISLFIMLLATFTVGIYYMLSTRYLEGVLGVTVVSMGINLLLIESGYSDAAQVDPLPQALILTAVVIGFALLTFVAAFSLHRFLARGDDAIPKVEEDH